MIMKKENMIYGVLVAVLLILPFCANLASAGEKGYDPSVKAAPAIYTELSSYAGTATVENSCLEQPAVDR